MKNKNTTTSVKLLATRAVLVVAALVMAAYMPTYRASADLNSEIAALESQIDGFQSEVTRLRGEANTYENAYNQLNAEKNAIQAQVNLSQARYDKLVSDIAANEKKMGDQQKVMSNAISDLSSESTTSPIELLASSKNIGDYIDQQEYSSSIRDTLETSINQIKKLKEELKKQKADVEIVLNDQKTQRDQLAAKEAEQANLLAATRGQEAEYQQLISQKNSELANKRAAQAAAMRGGSGAENIVYGASSYPWMDSSMAYDDYCRYYSGGSAADPFGYCKRQCVSYVAWKLNTDGRGNRGYSGLGNANQWSGGGAGVAWNNLQAGDVIIWYVGDYGHVMYVENISGTTVNISQMNVPYDSGRYSTASYSLSTLMSGSYEARRFH